VEGLTLRAPGHATFLAAPLLVGSVAPWATVAGPEAGIGTMGQGRVNYLAMWTGMTAAMMVSPLGWFASGYAGAIRREARGCSVRAARAAPLACGRASGFALLIAGCLAPWLPNITPGLHSVGMS
jgi:hypothetical protein